MDLERLSLLDIECISNSQHLLIVFADCYVLACEVGLVSHESKKADIKHACITCIAELTNAFSHGLHTIGRLLLFISSLFIPIGALVVLHSM